MRTNTEKTNYDNTDVYSGLGTSYAATYLAPDNQEFSLKSVQEKLGNIGQLETDTKDTVINADTMPTQQTLTMNYQREYEESAAKSVGKLSIRQKVAVISYVAVVLALILGITFTSLVVSGLFAGNVTTTAAYEQTLDDIAALEAELAVDDEAVLLQRAEELGYINANEAETATYTLLETRPAQSFVIESNWFDNLCDWLCGIFGE